MILTLENVRFGFLKEQPLFKDLSVDIEKGVIYTLMGANGTGKTTLFNLITGFLKLQSGNIYLNNERINNLVPFMINRKGICRTFQDLRLISKLTVKENILLAMYNNPTDIWANSLLPKSVYKNKIRIIEENTNTIINEYFLQDVQYSFAGEISYGQQKLLNLACCIANDADLLLLDEPVAGINLEYQGKISVILKKLKENGKTILMIEHNTEFINEVTDKILFLSNGNIAQFKDLETLKFCNQVY